MPTVVFAGPSDSESCDFCIDAVEDNPYELDEAPQPGDGECQSRCRHFLQLISDAPEDVPAVTWSRHAGFTREGISEFGREQDLADHRLIDKSNLASAPYEVVGVPGFDQAEQTFHGAFLPIAGLITFGALLDKIQDTNPADSKEMAQLLYSAGLTPDDVSGVMGLDTKRGVDGAYDDLLDGVNEEQIRELLRTGNVSVLQRLSRHPKAAQILSTIVAGGFALWALDDALTAGRVLDRDVLFDDSTQTWKLKESIAGTKLTQQWLRSHILATLHAAGESENRDGLDYWPKANRAVLDLAAKYQKPQEVIAGLLGALCPQLGWEALVQAVTARLGNQTTLQSREALDRADRILAGEAPQGVLMDAGGEEFAKHQRGLNVFKLSMNPMDENAVALDRHSIELALGERVDANEARDFAKGYAYFAQAYRDVAKELGILPSEVQAIAQTHWENVGGAKEPPMRQQIEADKSWGPTWVPNLPDWLQPFLTDDDYEMFFIPGGIKIKESIESIWDEEFTRLSPLLKDAKFGGMTTYKGDKYTGGTTIFKDGESKVTLNDAVTPEEFHEDASHEAELPGLHIDAPVNAIAHFSSSNTERVLIDHELGHVWQNSWNDEQKDSWRKALRECGKYYPTDTAMLDAVAHVSNYAVSDPSECFAEMFCTYVNGGEEWLPWGIDEWMTSNVGEQYVRDAR